MSHHTPSPARDAGPTRGIRRARAVGLLFVAGAALAACAPGASPAAVSTAHSLHDASAAAESDLQAARAATADFADLELAQAAGYASTIDDLGCFQDEDKGGMGLHYLDAAQLDDVLDVERPEALVYELDPAGAPAALVGLEFIVPVDAWTSDEPPTLFGNELHRHSVLPLWVIHAWVHRENPDGVLSDYNPDVALCPDGVPIFGVDLPKSG
ncbi:hypothetical protein [Microbacterium sp. P03]|uniref:hypothetical protein n=1 Tax=Microbacterium sp. P03 TaxID=3366946 RepID=UPI003747178F